ncbi:MAG: ACP S-malonyltransferase [Magnetococcales bacterium]|nr:ACP S-malonyltransferase [Magnetococcales bacterium]
MAKVALLFPGQGSQEVGMGRALQQCGGAVADCFAEADQQVGMALSQLMFDGPEQELRLTKNCQPALLTVSIAALRLLTERTGYRADFVAGHSLGEYSAVCAAGGFDLATAVRLVRLRGEAMQQAVPVGVGAMAAILNLDPAIITEICQQAMTATGGLCAPANYNAPGQLVVSGDRKTVEAVIERAKQRGAKRSLLLPVSAPFHCALMQPAADVMADALQQTALTDLSVPLVANVTAQPVRDGAQIRQLLVRQVTSAVRWEESIRQLVQLGVELFIELGSGKVLAGLVKRIAPEARIFSVSEPDHLDKIEDKITA